MSETHRLGRLMSDLKSSYERELQFLRRGLAEFTARNSRAAGRLSMQGEHSEDMHVERMIQSAALLNARVRERLEDDVPDFTVPLLEVLYPEFLRPFPSCSIACFEPGTAVERLTSPAVMPRGTHLTTRAGEYGFRTVYDTTVSALCIDDAAYQIPSAVPSNVRLPEGTSGVFSISFAVQSGAADFASAVRGDVRVFIDAQESAVAAVIDALVHRSKHAFLEVDSSGRWTALDSVPISPVGFGEREAVVDLGSESSYRLLLEYFAYPEKFHFLDFRLGQLLAGRSVNRRLSIHVPVFGLHPDSPPAVALATLSASAFRLRCTPVVNLFPCAAEPIALKDATLSAYPMVAQTVNPTGAEVWAVQSVRLTRDGDGAAITRGVKPFHSLDHSVGFASSTDRRQVLYWLASRPGGHEAVVAGGGCLLEFVTPRGEISEPPRDEQVDATLLCTNGVGPGSMQWGRRDGDFNLADRSVVARVSLLRRPSDATARPSPKNQYWSVVQNLSAGPFSLDQSGLPALKALLAAHAPTRGQPSEGQIEAIVGLSRETAMEWIVEKPQSRMTRGLRVRLTVDEQGLAGVPIAILARVLESVFVRYAPAHSFVQVVIVSEANGAELARGQLIPGAVPVL
ncbi:Protein ImpG/VasA [Paraburkholderia tropica]|uniref:type VI secretion system baseplate subunit TssF n=1 Tax=Paraburkholderia tropica TaxID=92647 RepID=UPI001CB360BE|nr:type VI secretion system baseplate subunit TssF [Paraburkholderia tropica]CAG9207598.1 Protein ImpG/VasA [Paraburkholderia tropica]